MSPGAKAVRYCCLPGWPETWWAYHKVMPELAKTHRVIAVDLRGMGSSDKPAGGYEKKRMAIDLSALVDQLGYEKVDVVGHDIGAMVAFSMAANHAGQVRRLVMLDVAHPSAAYLKLPLLPGIGTFGDKIDEGPSLSLVVCLSSGKGVAGAATGGPRRSGAGMVLPIHAEG